MGLVVLHSGHFSKIFKSLMVKQRVPYRLRHVDVRVQQCRHLLRHAPYVPTTLIHLFVLKRLRLNHVLVHLVSLL